MCERGRIAQRVFFELKNLDLIKDVDVKTLLPSVAVSPDRGVVWESARAEWLKWLSNKRNNDPLKAPLLPTNYRSSKTVAEEFARAVDETKKKYADLIRQLSAGVPYSVFLLMRVGIGFVHCVKIQ